MGSPYRDAPGRIPDRLREAERPTLVTYNVSGVRGTDGRHGRSGSSGSSSGAPGQRGADASPSSSGQDAGAIELRLEPTDIDNVARLRGVAVLPDGSQQAIDRTQTISAEGSIELIAIGGSGGHGGVGGNGGAGATGSAGRDATSYRSGSDGGPGGDGGDGGDGSSGSDGGNGGHLVVQVREQDTQLLMLVAHAVDAGRGGDVGRNGLGGPGGAGGAGGDSYSWTESDTRTDSEGNSYTETTHHYNPGGSQGPSGRPGNAGRARLQPGSDGSDGRLTFLVEGDEGLVSYASRYHLLLRSFEHQSSNQDLVYEPREEITVSKLVVENVGGMPTPAHSDVHVSLSQHGWIDAFEDQHLVVPRDLAPGERVTLDGTLRFRIEEFRPREASAPLERNETVRASARVVAVRREFDGFQTGEALECGGFVIRFPVRAGELDSLHSLAPDTTARMRWTITNQSRLALGAASSSGRRIRARLAALESELGDEHVSLFDDSGAPLAPSNGYVKEIELLEAGESQSFEIAIGMRKTAPPYRAITCRLSLELGDIDAPNELRAIQLRDFTTRVAQRYQEDPLADMLLVVNHRTGAAELAAWRALATQLGFTVSTWDLTLERRLALSEERADGRTLLDHFAGGTIVILNNAIDTATGAAHPHELISKSDVYAANAAGIHIAFVGANPNIEQLLLPLAEAAAEDEVETHDSNDGVITALATTSKDNAMVVANQRVEHHDRQWWGGLPEDADLGERASDMQEDLVAAYPDRRYVVVYDFEPEVASKFLWIKKWKVGEIEVKSTLDPILGSITHCALSELDVHNPAEIVSDATINTLLLARRFAGNLDRLAELTKAGGTPLLGDGSFIESAPPSDSSPLVVPRERLMNLLVGVLLTELGTEQDAITATRWREGLSRDELRDKMPRLARLSRQSFGEGLLPGSSEGLQLVELAARLRFFADSRVKLWERTPPIRFLRRAPTVAVITKQWVDDLFESAFGDHAKHARKMMKERLDNLDDLDKRRTFLPRQLLYAPIQSDEVTTDDELFASADARTLTAAELEAATVADRTAAERQAHLVDKERAAGAALLRSEPTSELLAADSASEPS